MLHISTVLKHYKRRDIQEAMIIAAQDREVAVKYGQGGFGKRPDILQFPDDILVFAKKGATSFHVSEERWRNPMQISTGMRRSELDSLRTGWDLVIDIDCPLWEYSRYIAHLVIQELRSHGITSVTAKFSGNKGFHIAVPFEAFPAEVNGKPLALLFPDGVRRIALYIADKVQQPLLDYIKENGGFSKVSEQLGIKEESLSKHVCMKCGKEAKMQPQAKIEFVCRFCDHREAGNEGDKFRVCAKCKKIMERLVLDKNIRCLYCKSPSIEEQLDLGPILQIDTVLISSRHLYRMPYSLHEKSGLCSIPIDSDAILSFERDMAKPELVKVDHSFLHTEVARGEAQRLVLEAFDYKPVAQKQFEKAIDKAMHTFSDDELAEAIPRELFPPCITLGLQGMQDGKKRFMFLLVNFLRSVGYGYDEIESILDEWNEKNPEALREVLIKGHVRYARQHNKKVMPPNCDNQGYYKDMGLCQPDNFCRRIKNPAQYAKKKAYFAQRDEEHGKRTKLTDEQKEMRRKYREKIKQEKEAQQASQEKSSGQSTSSAS